MQHLLNKPLWDIVSGELSDDIVDKIITTAKKYPEIDALTGTGYLDRSHRSCKATYIDLLKESWLKDLVWHYASISNLNRFNYDITIVEEPQFSVYNAKDNGHFDWHKDFYWDDVHRQTELYHRKLSMSIQLSGSDDYEGGDLEIDAGGPEEKNHISRYPGMKEQIRQKGTIVIFPSFIKHRVTPVTKGIRKSLVIWIDGPKFR